MGHTSYGSHVYVILNKQGPLLLITYLAENVSPDTSVLITCTSSNRMVGCCLCKPSMYGKVYDVQHLGNIRVRWMCLPV